MTKRRVVLRIYGMKYSWKGHKDWNRHTNRINRSGQTQLVFVKDIHHNIPTTWRWAHGDKYGWNSQAETSPLKEWHVPDNYDWSILKPVLSHDKPEENPVHLLAKNHLQPWPLSTVPAREYGDHNHQKAIALDWARVAQGCQLHHQSCNPLNPRGKAEAWSTEDNLVKNCGSRNEKEEPQRGHHPKAGQWQTGVEKLCCCPIHQLAWWVVTN